MLSVKTAALAGGGDTLFRLQFITGLKELVPSIRVLWFPERYDALLAYTDESSPRAVTWNASVTGLLTRQGHGYLQAFDGTTSFGTSPSTADLSFGNGVIDSPFSCVVLANVTDTAAGRIFVGKWDVTGSQREWIFEVGATDLLSFFVRDEALAVTPQRVSDSAITQASLHLFGMSYDGTGGATSMNGVVLYQDGAVIASTATNQATYVAMAVKTDTLEIGAQNAGALNWMSGSMGFVLVNASVLSAAQMIGVKGLVNTYFRLAL